MTEERKLSMLEASRNLATELERFVGTLKLPQYLADWIFEMPRRKIENEKAGIRGSFVKMVFLYLQKQAELEGITLRMPGPPDLFTVRLPLIAELIISAQYLGNQVFDGKGGLQKKGKWDHSRIHENIQASHYLKDDTYRYIAETAGNDLVLRNVLDGTVRRIFQSVDIGQLWETRYSTFENLYSGFETLPHAGMEQESLIDEKLITDLWQRFQAWGLPDWQASFAHFYLRRMTLTNAVLFRLMAEAVMDLTHYHGRERDNLLKFCTGFGLMAQLVNDIADCVPASRDLYTVHKIPEDAYADLRKGNPTLPMLFLAAAAKSKIDFRKLMKLARENEGQERVFEGLASIGSRKFIKMTDEFGKTLREYLNNSNPYYAAIESFCGVSNNNKFYREYWIKHRENKRK